MTVKEMGPAAASRGGPFPNSRADTAVLFDWFKRRRYRDDTIMLVVTLCPGTLMAVGGRHIKELAVQSLGSLYRSILDHGFAHGNTPEQTALAVVAEIIKARVSERPETERGAIGLELRGDWEKVTHPISIQISHVLDTTDAWKAIAKIQRSDIELFVSTILQAIP